MQQPHAEWEPLAVLWNYRVAQIGGTPQQIEAQLFQHGAEGWELVTMWATGAPNPAISSGYFTAVLKRPYMGQSR